MRRMWKILLLAGVFAVMLGTTALAAGEQFPPLKGIYDIYIPEELGDGLKLEAQTSGGASTTEKPATVTNPNDSTTSEKSIAINASKLGMTYSTTQGEECLVVVLNKDTVAPTANDIIYIDQVPAGEGGASFTLCPSKMYNSGTYYIYVATTSKGLSRVGSFSYYSIVGDANDDGTVTPRDASIVMKDAVGISSLSDKQAYVADVNNSADITPRDASLIMKVAVDIDSFV